MVADQSTSVTLAYAVLAFAIAAALLIIAIRITRRRRGI